MLLYFDCDMNLLVYGVGSKVRIIEDFLSNYIKPLGHDVVVCRPFINEFSLTKML